MSLTRPPRSNNDHQVSRSEWLGPSRQKSMNPKAKSKGHPRRGKGRHSKHGKFCDKTSLWKRSSLGFCSWKSSFHRTQTLLHLPPPFFVGHLLCSSRRDLSLSNYSPTKRESQDEVRLLTSFLALMGQASSRAKKPTVPSEHEWSSRHRAREALKRGPHSVSPSRHPGPPARARGSY